MSEQNNSSDVDVDGIEATREGTKQPSNQEGSILQACREEWGGGGGAVRRVRSHLLPHSQATEVHFFVFVFVF